MINSRIYDILITFSVQDWKDFTRFVKSSDTIANRRYYPLLLILKKYRKQIHRLKTVSEFDIFKQAYKRDFKKRTIYNRQNEFVNLLKEYIENTEYKKNNLSRTYFYIEGLLARGLFNLFSFEYNKKKKAVENNYYDEESFKATAQIINENVWFVMNKRQNFNESVNVAFKYDKALLSEILSSLFRAGQNFQLYKEYGIKKNNFSLNLIDSIDFGNFISYIEKSNEPEFTVPLIQYYIFKSLQNPDNSDYIKKAQEIFYANEIHFNEDFKIHIYFGITNYYNLKISKSETKYYKDAFLLFKRKIKNNIISDIPASYSSHYTLFRNYVITGLAVKEFKWVEMIIEKYSYLIPEEIREDENTMAIARLHFAKEEYKNTIEIIDNNNIKNTIYNLEARKFKLMCFYELKKYEECFKELDNTRHYLKTNKEKYFAIKEPGFKKFFNGFSLLLNFRTNPYNKDKENISYEFKRLDIPKEDWIYKKFGEMSIKRNK
jgi:hypothetical protein